MSIYLDEDDRLEGIENLFIRPTTTIQSSELPPEEENQIKASDAVAKALIGQTQLPRYNDALDPSKLSEKPQITERVSNAAATTGLVPAQSASEDIDQAALRDFLDELEIQKALLQNPEIPLPEIAELEGMPEAEKRGFLMQYANLVGELMELLSKLSDRDRKKNDHMRKEYDQLNREVGGAIGDRGTTNFYSNLIGFGIRCAGMTIPLALGVSADSTKIMNGLGDAVGQQVPQFMTLKTTKYDQIQTMSQSKLGMITTEMQNNSQKGGDNSGWRNELIQNLNDIKQWMSAAVRSGG